MSKLQLSHTVDAPIEKTFQLFSDFANAHRIDGIEKIEMLTDGPTGIGTRFKETRIMFGREATEEMEVTEFESNKLYTVAADSCGARFESTFRFHPVGKQTRVDMTMTSTPQSLFAKLFAPLGYLMAGGVKKVIASDIEQLAKVCEKT